MRQIGYLPQAKLCALLVVGDALQFLEIHFSAILNRNCFGLNTRRFLVFTRPVPLKGCSLVKIFLNNLGPRIET